MIRMILALLLIPSLVLASPIDWVNDGGDGWDDFVDMLGADDLDAVKTAVDDNDSRLTATESDLALRDEYYCEDYAGADIGARCNAAFAAMVAAGSGGVLWLPNSPSITQDTPIDFCDESGSNQLAPVILKGHGGAAGSSGSRLTASASLRPSAISPTSLAVTANAGVGGRDRITCVGCDFTTLVDRGDWITSAGFTQAANNIARTDGDMPLVVYAIAATYIDVEGYKIPDAGLVTESADADATLQKLVAQVKACSHAFRVEDLSLFGTSSQFADFGVLFSPDNNVNGACTGSEVPYPTCDGVGTGTGINPTAISTTIQRIAAHEHAWADIAITSTNDMGQADNFVIRDSRLQDSTIGVWMDTIQAHPALYVVNTDIHGFDRTGVLVTSGAAFLESNTIITESADCDAETYGPCDHVLLEDANTLGLTMVANDVEVKAGSGIRVLSQTTAGRHVILRDNAINQNDASAVTTLVDVAGLCGVMVNDGNKYRTVATGVTTAPSVTFSNSNQASCPAILSGVSAYFLAAGAGTQSPALTVENGIPITVTAGSSGASCVIFRDSDDAGNTACSYLNGVASCETDTNGICGDAT